MSEEKAITDGQRLKNFLEDEVVRAAFGRLEQSYFAEFQNADTPAVRESVWAKQKALMDLARELRATVDRGTRAAADKARRERNNLKR